MTLFEVDEDTLNAHVLDEVVDDVAQATHVHYYEYDNPDRQTDLRWVNGTVATIVNEYIRDSHSEDPTFYAGTPQYDEYVWVKHDDARNADRVASFAGSNLSKHAMELPEEYDERWEEATRNFLYSAASTVASKLLDKEKRTLVAPDEPL